MRYFCSPHHQDSALFPIVGQIERSAGFERDDAPKARWDKLETLLAATHTIAEIREFLEADSVAYLSLEGMMSAVGSEKSSYCSSCYTGHYPVECPSDETRYLQLALKLDKEKEPVAN